MVRIGYGLNHGGQRGGPRLAAIFADCRNRNNPLANGFIAEQGVARSREGRSGRQIALGITSVKMKSGAAGKAQVQVKGKGALLRPPAPAGLVPDVIVQLLIDDGGALVAASVVILRYPAGTMDSTADLLAYIDASPTPYHAVTESARRLESVGFRRIAEPDRWDLSAGDRIYVVRGDGSVLAAVIGAESPATAGFRILGAHTDSPNLRLKPQPDVKAHGYRQLAVERYGGLLLHTWLDRDLSLAGRVIVRGDEGPQTLLLDFARPLLRVPSLAIHLYRELAQDGLKLNPQQHAVPVVGLDGTADLTTVVATELGAQGIAAVDRDAVLAFDLMLYDTQFACISGAAGEFIHAARLDNLASCHAALAALVAAADSAEAAAGCRQTCAVVLYDHEEVGSRSAQGAGGPFLMDALGRIIHATDDDDPQSLPRALARSMVVSVDMAHAVHPNYADRHEPEHRPVIGKGPVIKVHAGQSYASDAETVGLFRAVCAAADVAPQYFVTRSDLPCGSTIGPITAARAGIRTVDVGNPMLSMHSCREMAGTADVEPMIRVLRGFLEGA